MTTVEEVIKDITDRAVELEKNTETSNHVTKAHGMLALALHMEELTKSDRRGEAIRNLTLMQMETKYID